MVIMWTLTWPVVVLLPVTCRCVARSLTSRRPVLTLRLKVSYSVRNGKRLHGSTPFQSQSAGRCSDSRHHDGRDHRRRPPKRLLRSALRVLYGGPRRDLPAPDFASRSADRVCLQMDCPFTLDGQMFAAPADAPLVITAPETVDFVRC